MGRQRRSLRGRTVALLCAAAGLVACGAGDPTASSTARQAPLEIGILRSVADDDHEAFLDELRVHGWSPGVDVRIRPRDANRTYADVDEAREALRRWVDDDVDVVVAFSTPYAQLVHDEAPGVPALFGVNDPVTAGLVHDLGRPDGGLSGVTFRTPADRTLDLARRMLGGLTRVGYLSPSDDPAVAGHRRGVLEAVDELDLELTEARYATPDDVPAAVRELQEANVEAVLLASSNATVAALPQLEAELERHRLPAIANTDFVEFAVLLVAPDGTQLRRQLGRQAARLLSGAEVSSVPVEHPRRFTVIIDRTHAERLGLPEIDPDLLRQADVVR